jgi:conjugal transfer/entry exclusion protein
MVAPAFGFSVGDFIAGTKILISVISAFKDTGGASGKYASEVSFLNSLTATLQHVEKQADGTSQDAISRDISRLLQMTQGPLDDFKKFLDKYQALEKSPTKSTLSKTSRVIGYTVKDISGKVERLRRQVEQPLQAVNSLLSLQAL